MISPIYILTRAVTFDPFAATRVRLEGHLHVHKIADRVVFNLPLHLNKVTTVLGAGCTFFVPQQAQQQQLQMVLYSSGTHNLDFAAWIVDRLSCGP